jgi:hypothetical protein
MIMKWPETSESEENPWIFGPSQKVCLDLKNSRISRIILSGCVKKRAVGGS